MLGINSINIYSQSNMFGLPYIDVYTPEQYKAHKQTWAATQDGRGVMYFANTTGVLEFDGYYWRLIKINNKNLVVRALFTDKTGRVFVGCPQTMGYLAPNKIGEMTYVSLVDKIENEKYRNFKGINSIFSLGDTIYFAGDDILFKYYNDKIISYPIKGLRQTHQVNGRIFIRISQKGLFEFINDKAQLLPQGNKYKDIGFINVLPYDDKIIIVTVRNGLLLYDGVKIQKLSTPIDDFLSKNRVISATMIQQNQYAIGTLSAGLIIVNKQWKFLQHLHSKVGLKDNLISNIYKDNCENLWLTGHNISYVLNSLPVSKFDAKQGLTSTTHAALEYNNILYTGSISGLYYQDLENIKNNRENSKAYFKQLGMPQNIWQIDTINGILLSATNMGVVEFQNQQTRYVVDNIGVWKLLRVNNNKLLIAGTNDGLLLLGYKAKQKKKKQFFGNWHIKNKVKGFNGKCRHIVIDKSNDLWLSHSTKLIKRLSFNRTMDSVSVKKYVIDDPIKDVGKKYVFRVNNKILVGTKNGIYQYSDKEDKFILSKDLNHLIEKGIQVVAMSVDDKGNIYYKQKRKSNKTDDYVYELGKFVLQDDGTYINYKKPFYRLRNSIYSMTALPNNKLLIGALKGFVMYQPNDKLYNKPYKTIIRSVELISQDSIIYGGCTIDSIANKTEITEVDFENNDLQFTFAAPYFDSPKSVVYKFYLEGNDKTWSDWETKNYKEYSNLTEGNYTFRVKAKNIYETESNEAVYSFTILPPWYRTAWAIVCYMLFVAMLIWGIVRLSVRRLRKQKEYLEQVVKERTAEIRLKNEQLSTKNKTIEEKNDNITASITYAKRIQEAMLPLLERIDNALEDYFILFKPRDIVSGDFYWFAERDGKIIFTAVDCTGHGVPGAFMSMIGSEILTTIVNKGITKPSEILDNKDMYVKKALKQDKTENHDGMDMSLCTIDKKNKIVEWAGANNPLIYIQNNKLTYIKGDLRSIGGYQIIPDVGSPDFTNHQISYKETPSYFYIFSDGFQDQFGGPKERKFMVKRLKQLILDNHKKPMEEQHKIYDSAIEEWMLGQEQTDDILLIGFKLTP